MIKKKLKVKKNNKITTTTDHYRAQWLGKKKTSFKELVKKA